MTEWASLVAARDNLYLQMFFVTGLGLAIYRLFPARVLFGGLVGGVVVSGLILGLGQL